MQSHTSTERQVGILTILAERRRRLLRQRNIDQLPDLALVLSKSDMVPEIRDNQDFRNAMDRSLPGFVNKLAHEANHLALFRLASHPKTGGPMGIEPLITWIGRQNKNRNQRPLRRTIAFGLASLAVAVLGIGGWAIWNRDQSSKLLFDESISPTDRLIRTAPILSGNSELWQKMYAERLEALSRESRQTDNEKRLNEILEEVEQLHQARSGTARNQRSQLGQAIQERIEQMWIARIQEAADNQPARLPSLIEKFHQQFPDSRRRGTVEEWVRRSSLQVKTSSRNSIRNLAVSDAKSLANKGSAIGKYLTQYRVEESQEEVRRMKRASELAQQFSQINQYHAKIKRTGNFTSPRIQHVKVLVDGVLAFEGIAPSPATISYWDGQWFDIRWRAGQSVEVMLVSKSTNWFDTSFYWVARRNLNDPLALRALASDGDLQVKPGWKETFVENLPILEMELQEVSSEDWQIVSDYLDPGNRW